MYFRRVLHLPIAEARPRCAETPTIVSALPVGLQVGGEKIVGPPPAPPPTPPPGHDATTPRAPDEVSPIRLRIRLRWMLDACNRRRQSSTGGGAEEPPSDPKHVERGASHLLHPRARALVLPTGLTKKKCHRPLPGMMPGPCCRNFEVLISEEYFSVPVLRIAQSNRS